MNREELIKLLQSWLTTATDDNGNPIHVIMDVDIHEIATEIIKSSLPPAEGAEKVQRCPVCMGKGLVPNSFYATTSGIGSTTQTYLPEKCRTCYGAGVIQPPYLQRQPQPTAEGAEEIFTELEFVKLLVDNTSGKLDDFEFRKIVNKRANDFATLHAQRIAEKMVEEDDLQKLMNDISEWSDKTFGNGQRNPAIIYHLKKEVDELIAAIEKTNTLGSDPSVGVGEFGRQRTVTRVEYADCLMLLLDSAHHFGISAKELLSVTRGKLEINKVRKWGSPDENGVVEHIE